MFRKKNGRLSITIFYVSLEYVAISPHVGVTSINCDRIFHSKHINWRECI